HSPSPAYSPSSRPTPTTPTVDACSVPTAHSKPPLCSPAPRSPAFSATASASSPSSPPKASDTASPASSSFCSYPPAKTSRPHTPRPRTRPQGNPPGLDIHTGQCDELEPRHPPLEPPSPARAAPPRRPTRVRAPSHCGPGAGQSAPGARVGRGGTPG